MLFFRSEEHIDRWCESWRLRRGAVMTLDTNWRLAQDWYSADRREPNWRRRTVPEVQEVFRRRGLTGEFWQL